MASTRSSTTRQRDASAESPKAALITLAQRGVRVQIAGWTAAAKTLTGWAEAVDRLAQTVGDELLRRIDGKSDSPELAACLTTATSSHFRELAALPRTAAHNFDARMGRAPSTARRSR